MAGGARRCGGTSSGVGPHCWRVWMPKEGVLGGTRCAVVGKKGVGNMG